MASKIYITKTEDIRLLAIYEEDEVFELHPLISDKNLSVGEIYLGRVEKVVKNINSAFIRLSDDLVGYLQFTNDPIYKVSGNNLVSSESASEGDYIIVMIKKEPLGDKKAALTSNISLSGESVVVCLNENITGISTKLDDRERFENLKQNLINHSSNDKNYGFILRSCCNILEDKTIIDEYEYISKELSDIINKALFTKGPGLLKRSKHEYIKIINQYGIYRVDEIKTDIKEVYDELTLYYNDKDTVLSFYDEKDYDLFKLMSLQKQIDNALSKKVWLKSGGFLYIEPTEAMVVIDVNSGKSIKGKDKEKHIFKINSEAAKEIARQIRLRNLSGIIMIDFINMESEESKTNLESVLKSEIKGDRYKTTFVERTKLDIYELTRKKMENPLHIVMRDIKENN